MTLRGGADPAPKVLCILDNDFGDLGFAMYFLEGQPFADSTTLLLPPRLADRDDGQLPVATRRFSSADDIVRVVDEEKPAVVLLLSGYMLAIHGLVRRAELPRLVKHLCARCRVVTSDPFLGLASEGNLAGTFGISLPDKSVGARLLEVGYTFTLLRHLRTARAALEQLPHLYQFRPSGTPDRKGVTGPERISFYNPELVKANGGGGTDQASDGPREWLFIVGSSDWGLQRRLHGSERFADLIADKLEETVDAGRTPVLVAPAQLLDDVRPRVSRSDRMRLLSFLGYSSFDALMRTAEYVFYWNIISYSSLLRVVHDRPFFLFHQGHLVHNVKGLRERVRAWYYRGWEPVMLDQTKRLDRDRLGELAEDFREASSRIRTELAHAPAPAAVLAKLLGPR
jgi:hypothetical protein